MKPFLINLAYFALGYLLLSNALAILAYFQFENNDSNFPFKSIVVTTATIVSIIGFLKKCTWARIVASSIITFDTTITLGTTLYFIINIQDNVNLFISSFIISLIFFFLAYKIYISQSLKEYLN